LTLVDKKKTQLHSWGFAVNMKLPKCSC